MPEKSTQRRAEKARRQGKSSSTQAGEYVREEMHHVRSGRHGAKNSKQAIAIGLSKARRSGVNVPKRGKSSRGGSSSSNRSSSSSNRSSSSSRSGGSSSGKTWRSGGGSSGGRSRGRSRSRRGGSSRSRSSSSRSRGRSRGRSGGRRGGSSRGGGSRSGGSPFRAATWSSSPRVTERQDALVGGPLGGVVI